MTFPLRLLLLLLLRATAAFLDWLWHRERATRWREYSFLLAAGLVGGFFGAACDQVSLALAPEYFELAKGIDPGPGFRTAVTWLGFQAGLVGGLVAGGILLVARGARPPAQLPLSEVARLVPWPLGGAVLLAPLGALLAPPWDPLGLRSQLLPLLPATRVEPVLRVWGLHAGLYAGALLGLTVAVVVVRRRLKRRRALSAL